MSSSAEHDSYRLDGLKWAVVGLLLAAGVFANHTFSAEPLYYRVAGLLVIVAIAGIIAFQTRKGAAMWGLVKGAQTEARRVVWPTRQERNQTTLVVVLFILVMALILWGLDSFFGWITSMIIG